MEIPKSNYKIVILTDIQTFVNKTKCHCLKKIQRYQQKNRKLLKELNSLLTIFYLQAQKLTQVNSKKQSPDVIISSQFLCVYVCVCVCVCVCVK